MKKAIAEKWVAALRSGEYKQHRGMLANDERTEHCCLGVLCELAIKEGVKVEVDMRPYYAYFDERVAGLPDKVQNWSGVSTAEGLLNGGLALAALNDRNWPFEQIADVIEKHWKEL